MIDLTKKSLPNTVSVGGGDFSIYTDFRIWIRLSNDIKRMKQGSYADIRYLFKNENPPRIDIESLIPFLSPERPLPRSEGSDNIIVLDYELDSDLIYSAFLGQYGIDLTLVEELHWHKFLALLSGLNESTKLREVMSYRCYKRDDRKDIDHYEELKRAWEIVQEEEDADLEEFNRQFGG